MNKTSEVITFLELRKQVYYCKNCQKKFVASTKIVNKGCSISNNVKNSVFHYCKNPISKKLIGDLHNVSDNTVQNIINEKMTKEKLYKNYLPEYICFDEFTYKKKVFAFNMCDASTGKLIDLVEDRSTQNLEKYFSYYSKKCREKVKLIIIDMYSPYMELIKKWFPNAKIIIDLFHIVQLLTKSLNKTRIDTMKTNKEYQTKFKRYWRLILTSRFDLNNSKWKKFRCFKEYMTESDVVDHLINTNEELKESYIAYQDILYYLQRRNYNNFYNIINQKYENVSERMKTTINTLSKYAEYICNTLEQPYSNGVMERNNNTCKLLKRVSFGYRNFSNMKKRMMIILNIFRVNKREYQTKYCTPKYI